MPPPQRVVAMTILLGANWRDAKVWDDGHERTVPRGTLWTTLPRLAMDSGVSIKSVRTALVNLEKLGFIGRQIGRHGQLISVTKYEDYQDAEGASAGQRQDPGRPAASPPLLEEGKKGGAPQKKTKVKAVALPKTWKPTPAHHKLAADLGVNVHHEAETFRDHALAKGRALKDWGAAFRNWLRKSAEWRGNRPALVKPPEESLSEKMKRLGMLRE